MEGYDSAYPPGTEYPVHRRRHFTVGNAILPFAKYPLDFEYMAGLPVVDDLYRRFIALSFWSKKP